MTSSPLQRRPSARLAFPVLALLVLALVAAGCGGDSSSATTGETGAGGQQLTHVEGTLRVVGNDTIEVTAPGSGQPVQVGIGPEVELAAVQAIAASGEPARVLFADEADPVAVRVESATTVEPGTDSYVGTVVRVSAEEITIDGDDGERTFAIEGEDRSAFDSHLEEHQEGGDKVEVFIAEEDGRDRAKSYQDAR